MAISGYLEPLSAVLLSVLILHETMTPLQIAGAVLIIGGAVCGNLFWAGSAPEVNGKSNGL